VSNFNYCHQNKNERKRKKEKYFDVHRFDMKLLLLLNFFVKLFECFFFKNESKLERKYLQVQIWYVFLDGLVFDFINFL